MPAPANLPPTERPRRRTFTAEQKLRILAEADTATEPGAIGALLRREGLYASALRDWRRQRDAGALGALAPVRRGPKPVMANPLSDELTRLERENADLKLRLTRAEMVIDLQKKVSELLGLPMDPTSRPGLP